MVDCILRYPDSGVSLTNMNSAANTISIEPKLRMLPTGGCTFTAAGMAELTGLPIGTDAWEALDVNERRRRVGERVKALRAKR